MAKRVNISPAVFADRWSNGMSNASQKIQSGIEAVTEAPGQKAAAAVELWFKRIQQSKDKFARNVAAVSLNDWKQAAIKKGIPAIQNSVSLAKPKVQKAAEKLIPAINNALSDIPERGMTLEENMRRVLHMARGLQEAFA